MEKTKKRQSKKLPKILSRQDVKKLLAVPNVRCITGLRSRVIIQVLYRAGLRAEELCNLAPADVNLADGFVYVQQGKNSKDRYVPIDKITINWLRKWDEVRPDVPFFFCSGKGKKLDQSYIRKIIYQAAEKAGVYIQDGRERVLPHPHTLRHCYATELLEEGYTLADVQALLGHSSITTTSVYLHVRPLALAAKIKEREAI